MAAVDAERPDAVVTDIRMPPTSKDERIEVAARLRETNPRTGVVVLSQFADAAYALRLFDQGASGRLSAQRAGFRPRAAGSCDPGGRPRRLRRRPEGRRVLIEARSRKKESVLEQLTPREKDVLAQVAEGKNNAAIAATLFLTERGVEKHINAIFSKLELSEETDVHRRVKAALIFLMEGQHP